MGVAFGVQPVRRRQALALAGAVILHLVLVLPLTRAPRSPPVLPEPATSAVEVSLLSPRLSATPSEPAATVGVAASRAEPRLAQSLPPAGIATIAPPSVADPGSARSGAVRGSCDREVLLLLTSAERERCVSQVVAEAERRATRRADDERGRRIAEARAEAPIDAIPIESRIHYDAIAAAKKSSRTGAGFDELARIQNQRIGGAAAEHRRQRHLELLIERRTPDPVLAQARAVQDTSADWTAHLRGACARTASVRALKAPQDCRTATVIPLRP